MGGDHTGFLYQAVSGKIAGLIDQGVLRPGDRVPSVRRISAQEGVSVSTTLQAYTLLESRGYIEARPQSGFYVRARLAAQPPEPRGSNQARQTTRVGISSLMSRILLAASDPAVVPLGAACPAPELLPIRRISHIMAGLLRRAGNETNAYTFLPGNREFQRQIARRSLDWGGRLDPDEILATSGATEAMHLCLRAVTRPGDMVAVESPAFFGILLQLETLGLKAVEIPCHPQHGLRLDVLHDVLRKQRVSACVASPNFSNPLGSCMSDDAKRELVEMLAGHGVPLIEDDLYGDIQFDGPRPRAAKAFDRAGMVLLCSSFSKLVAPGYRVGWTAAGRFQARVQTLKMSSTMVTPSLMQMAIAEYLESGSYDRHLRRVRAAFKLQTEQMIAAVSEHFPAGTRVGRPRGGFVLWVELPSGSDALDLLDRALAKGISISPGRMFSPRQRYENYVRLSCGYPWSPRLDQAVRTLATLI